MAVRLMQYANGPSPMLVTLAGIVTPGRLVQDSNAPSPMLVTPSEIVTLVRRCSLRTHNPRWW